MDGVLTNWAVGLFLMLIWSFNVALVYYIIILLLFLSFEFVAMSLNYIWLASLLKKGGG